MYSMKKLKEKVHQLRELERQAEDLKTQIEILKDELKGEMDKRGATELVGDDWKINWTPYQQTRFDQSIFKEAHPDLYQDYCKIVESRRFSVR